MSDQSAPPPGGEQSQAPQEQAAPAPQEQAAPAPQEQAQPAPQEQAQPAPQEQAAPAPQEQAQPAPQEQPAPQPQAQQPDPQPQAQPAPREAPDSHQGDDGGGQSGPPGGGGGGGGLGEDGSGGQGALPGGHGTAIDPGAAQPPPQHPGPGGGGLPPGGPGGGGGGQGVVLPGGKGAKPGGSRDDDQPDIQFVHERSHAHGHHAATAPGHGAVEPQVAQAHGSVAIDPHSVRHTAVQMRSCAAELRHTTHRLHPHAVLSHFPPESRLSLEDQLRDLLATFVVIVEELEREASDLEARAGRAEADGLDEGGAASYRGGFES